MQTALHKRQLPNEPHPPTDHEASANGSTGSPSKVVYLRRRQSEQQSLEGRTIRRYRVSAMSMALVAMMLVFHRRMDYDSLLNIVLELVLGGALLWIAWGLAKRRGLQFSPSRTTVVKEVSRVITVVALIVLPWVLDILGRWLGYGNGLEIVMLASLSWLSLLLAVSARELRTVSLSVVCSGFLTLFSTFIADSFHAVWLTLAWGVMCMWWLVSRQWEKMETIAPGRVHRTQAQVWGTVTLGCLVFLGGSLLVSNRIPALQKIKAELMPTSGGSSGKDSAARRGVGNGDALIAARKHATSFGAVETDMFLDSDKPSLFDVFSDEFGEPIKKNRVERAQALTPQQVRSQEGNFTEANRASGSSEFSIDRELPEQHRPVNDLVAESLMFWQGECGALLAVQRFDQFSDGVWYSASGKLNTTSTSTGSTPAAVVIDDQTWFQPANRQVQNSLSPYVDALPEAIKFTRYRSPVIPSRSGMQLWCIDQIDRADFFSLRADDCLEMPGREHVPDYTVVRVINSRIDLERLEKCVRDCSPGSSHRQPKGDCLSDINQLAHKYAGSIPRGWEQVQAIVTGLRKDFVHDRLANNPASADLSASVTKDAGSITQVADSHLTNFLKSGRGPDYLFATAAALMLDHLGYRTRLVAGFSVNPEHYIAREGEYAILPRDAHVWVEMNSGHGYWVPLEPTPGYAMPSYRAGLWFMAKRHAKEIALSAFTFLALVLVIYLMRAVIAELAIWLSLPLPRFMSDRGQVVWLAWLLDLRCHLAGLPRRQNVAPRQHLRTFQGSLPIELNSAVIEYFRGADQLVFGNGSCLSDAQRNAVQRLWRDLTVGVLKHSRREVKSS